MLHSTLQSLCHQIVVPHPQSVAILDENKLKSTLIDQLIEQAVFGEPEVKPGARWLIWEIAQEMGIYPSSIHPYYMARGRKLIPLDRTVPAMNIRGLTYDTAQALFEVALETKSQAFIIELARGEMLYTDQSPAEFTTSILAGAIKVGYEGPVFIQGDHFQLKSKQPAVPEAGEVEKISHLIEQAIEAGFYNIDIDASTLVNLSAAKVSDQQAANIRYTKEFLNQIRSLEPAGVTISVGGEIGHIGGKNSTLEDFTVFMTGLNQAKEVTGISKISIATGTSHGGVVNPDGSMADVAVDFDLIDQITQKATSGYSIAGAVQHGASTLPEEWLSKFPAAHAAEIHLATGFQNLIFDHESFPEELKTNMYSWLDEHHQAEKEKGWTDAQFHYKLRKKTWGNFKSELWHLPQETRNAFKQTLSAKFKTIFEALNISDSQELINEHTPTIPIHKEIIDFALELPKDTNSNGLSD